MSYVEEVIQELSKLSVYFSDQVDVLAHKIGFTVRNGSNVYIAGNGGSASTAQHFSVDLISVGKLSQRTTLPIYDLTSNSALMLAIGNDVSFQEVFAAQIGRLGTRGDLLIVFSASGKSPNLIRAVEVAKELGLGTFGVLGFTGDDISLKVDDTFHCNLHSMNYGIAEDLHLSFAHAVTDSFRRILNAG